MNTKTIAFIKILLFILTISVSNVNASVIDSLYTLLGANINDSTKFEVYNQIFPTIVKQNIDSAYNCLEYQKVIIKNVKFSKSTTDEFYIDIYNNSGIYYNRTGKQDTAIALHKKALEIADRIGKQRVSGITLNNIANIYYLRGNYKASLDYHLKALRIRKEINDTMGIAMSYGNIGLIHSSLKEYQKCISYYNKAKAVFEQTKNLPATSWAYRAIGVAYLDLKQFDHAITNLEKSLKICSKIGDFSGTKYGLLNLGIVYLGMYENEPNIEYLDSAESAFEKVYKLQQKSYIKRIDINYLNFKAQILIYRKKYTEAIELLNKSENLLSDIELKTELKDVYKFKSKAYEQSKDFKLALDNYKSFKLLTDSLFTIEKDKEIGRKEAEFEYNEKLKIAEIESRNRIELEKSEKQRLKLWLIIIVLFVIIIIGISIFTYYKLTKQSRLLKQQKAQILRKYNNIEEAYNEAITNIEELKTQQENKQEKNKPLPDWINALSKRETEVLSCLAVGMSDKEIENKLFISVTTVRTHCQRIYGKLLVKNRMEAANLAREYGLI